MVFLIGITLYALIKLFEIDTSLSSNLLNWSATLFPSIVIIYTFQSWRNQKASEIVASEAKEIAQRLNEHIESHKMIIRTRIYGATYIHHLDTISGDYLYLQSKLYFLTDLVSEIYDKRNVGIFIETRNAFLREHISYTSTHYANYDFRVFPDSNTSKIKLNLDEKNEKYAIAHLHLHNILIKIMMHSESLELSNEL